VLVKRAMTQHLRGGLLNVFDLVLHGGTGMFLGFASGVVDFQSLGQASLM
jgi:hypothetical protein